MDHLDSVYLGLVEATGSLFAMSPGRFPLVAFSGAGRGRVKLETALAGGEPKQRLYGSEDEDGAEGRLDRSSRRCLVGMHPLEAGDEDSPENRLKRLVDGVPGVVREDHK
jgi:serine/threonine-protein kinase/endoribonuclease IRE1